MTIETKRSQGKGCVPKDGACWSKTYIYWVHELWMGPSDPQKSAMSSLSVGSRRGSDTPMRHNISHKGALELL
jgi:hypothetical protein